MIVLIILMIFVHKDKGTERLNKEKAVTRVSRRTRRIFSHCVSLFLGVPLLTHSYRVFSLS